MQFSNPNIFLTKKQKQSNVCVGGLVLTVRFFAKERNPNN